MSIIDHFLTSCCVKQYRLTTIYMVFPWICITPIISLNTHTPLWPCRLCCQRVGHLDVWTQPGSSPPAQACNWACLSEWRWMSSWDWSAGRWSWRTTHCPHHSPWSPAHRDASNSSHSQGPMGNKYINVPFNYMLMLNFETKRMSNSIYILYCT